MHDLSTALKTLQLDCDYFSLFVPTSGSSSSFVGSKLAAFRIALSLSFSLAKYCVPAQVKKSKGEPAAIPNSFQEG